MANVEASDGSNFVDLGRFSSIDCIDIMGKPICKVKFSEGNITLSKRELDMVCGMEGMVESRNPYPFDKAFTQSRL